MPEVNFYLKKPEPIYNNKGDLIPWKKSKDEHGNPIEIYPDSCLSLIYLQMKYGGDKVTFSFNQTIQRGYWDFKKQRVKNNSKTTTRGDQHINDLLDSLERICINSHRSQLKNGQPDSRVIKQALTEFVLGTSSTVKNSLKQLIDRFISGEILIQSGKRRGMVKQPSTLKNYNLTKNRLLEFERVKKIPLTYESITIDYYEKLLSFLRSKKHADAAGNSVRTISDSSIGNTIKDLKTFMEVAVDREYTTNMQFKKKAFAKLTEETDAVYNPWPEIMKLYRHDFIDNNRLQETRDLYVAGCCLSLRFSDFNAIEPENIVQSEGEYYIKMITQKNGELVWIPCHPILLEIFDKYPDRPNRLPRSISNQKFNQYIKEVFKAAGFTEKGRLIDEPEKELWECISSHTARRSGLTNLYLDGFPVIDIMKISSHKTEKAFLTYIKVSKEDTAKRMGAAIKKNWSQKLLRIAI